MGERNVDASVCGVRPAGGETSRGGKRERCATARRGVHAGVMRRGRRCGRGEGFKAAVARVPLVFFVQLITDQATPRQNNSKQFRIENNI